MSNVRLQNTPSNSTRDEGKPMVRCWQYGHIHPCHPYHSEGAGITLNGTLVPPRASQTWVSHMRCGDTHQTPGLSLCK